MRNGIETKSTLDLSFARTYCKMTAPSVVDLQFSDHKRIGVNLGRNKHKKETRLIKKCNLSSNILEDALLNPCHIDSNDTDVNKQTEELSDWLPRIQDKA